METTEISTPSAAHLIMQRGTESEYPSQPTTSVSQTCSPHQPKLPQQGGLSTVHSRTSGQCSLQLQPFLAMVTQMRSTPEHSKPTLPQLQMTCQGTPGAQCPGISSAHAHFGTVQLTRMPPVQSMLGPCPPQLQLSHQGALYEEHPRTPWPAPCLSSNQCASAPTAQSALRPPGLHPLWLQLSCEGALCAKRLRNALAHADFSSSIPPGEPQKSAQGPPGHASHSSGQPAKGTRHIRPIQGMNTHKNCPSNSREVIFLPNSQKHRK